MVGWFFQTAACLLGPSPRQREEADDAHWLGIDGRVRTLVHYPFNWLSLQRDDEMKMMTMMMMERMLAALLPVPPRNPYPSSMQDPYEACCYPPPARS